MNAHVDCDVLFVVLGFDYRSFMRARPVRTEEDAARVEAELKTAVKQRYQELALKEHPDKGGDPERFKLINQAHEFIQKELRVRLPRRIQPITFVFQDIQVSMDDVTMSGWSYVANYGMNNTTASSFYGGMTS